MHDMFGQVKLYRPHQLGWGEQKMEMAISCTKYSQVAGLVHMLGEECMIMSYNVGFK